MNVSVGVRTAVGKSIPALAFFHICLPEYTEMIEAHVPISGVQQEACGSASVDSGLFTAFLEGGDVKVPGHHHPASTTAAFFLCLRRPSCYQRA